jgi:hypothetical protein
MADRGSVIDLDSEIVVEQLADEAYERWRRQLVRGSFEFEQTIFRAAYEAAVADLRRVAVRDDPERASEIPRSYWREVPCGHPPDPVRNPEGVPICHCGWGLDDARACEPVPEAPGPIVNCDKCGCYVAIPPAAVPSSDEEATG